MHDAEHDQRGERRGPEVGKRHEREHEGASQEQGPTSEDVGEGTGRHLDEDAGHGRGAHDDADERRARAELAREEREEWRAADRVAAVRDESGRAEARQTARRDGRRSPAASPMLGARGVGAGPACRAMSRRLRVPASAPRSACDRRWCCGRWLGERPRARGARRLRKRPVQRLEERDPALQQQVVLGRGQLEPLDQRADRACVGGAEAAVLQVEVVHDLGDARDGRIRDAEDGAQGLERAALALMAELDAEHVERNRVRGRKGLAVDRELESASSIDEASNQPRRAHAIDAGTRARHPQRRL